MDVRLSTVLRVVLLGNGIACKVRPLSWTFRMGRFSVEALGGRSRDLADDRVYPDNGTCFRAVFVGRTIEVSIERERGIILFPLLI